MITIVDFTSQTSSLSNVFSSSALGYTTEENDGASSDILALTSAGSSYAPTTSPEVLPEVTTTYMSKEVNTEVLPEVTTTYMSKEENTKVLPEVTTTYMGKEENTKVLPEVTTTYVSNEATDDEEIKVVTSEEKISTTIVSTERTTSVTTTALTTTGMLFQVIVAMNIYNYFNFFTHSAFLFCFHFSWL